MWIVVQWGEKWKGGEGVRLKGGEDNSGDKLLLKEGPS